MNKRLFLAFFLLLTGIASIVDWILFSANNKQKPFDFAALKLKYEAHLPAFLRPLFHPPIIITGIYFLFFVVAGLIFLKEQKKGFKILAIFSFLLAFWELFSLM